jgi:hypothetical protein
MGLSVGVEATFLTTRPRRPLISESDIPIRAALPYHGTQILSQFLNVFFMPHIGAEKFGFSAEFAQLSG